MNTLTDKTEEQIFELLPYQLTNTELLLKEIMEHFAVGLEEAIEMLNEIP
jgi:hypothetical protein